MKKRKTKTKFNLNALVWQEDDIFVAKSVEIEVASQGKSSKKALSNLEEALELYFEDEKIPESSIAPLSNLKLHKLFPKISYA